MKAGHSKHNCIICDIQTKVRRLAYKPVISDCSRLHYLALFGYLVIFNTYF